MDVIEIEWLDAHSATRNTSVKRAAKNKPVLTRSVGYLIAENEHGITLVSDCWPDEPGQGFNEGFIGWGMISKIWRYEIVNK